MSGDGMTAIPHALKTNELNDKLLVAISAGDPALGSGGGDMVLLYGGIIAGIAGSILMWWFFNRRMKDSV